MRPARLIFGFAALAGLGAVAVAAVELASGPTIALPPMVVEGKGVPLRWRYLAQPGLELLTVCSDETAVDFVRRNRRLEELLSAFVAPRFRFQTAVPETHILFNEETGRARSQEVIAEMVNAQGMKLAGDGNLQLRQEVTMPGVTLGLPGGQQTFRIQPHQVFFLPNLRLADRDSLAVFSILPDRITSLTFGYSETRVQFLLEARAPALPEWFIAGVLGLFRQADFDEHTVTLRPLVWRSEAASRALKQEPESPRGLLPLAQLLAGRRPAPQAEPTEQDEIWAAQCTLFLRWALAEEKGARRAALEKFVDRLDAGEPTEALFEECFGLGFADARDRLSDYLPVAVSRRAHLDPPKLERLPYFASRVATPLEIARLRGNWERREIPYVQSRYPSLAGSYLQQARTTLHRAYDAGERDPQLLAELGLTELEGDNPAGARRFLEAAVAGGVVRPGVLFELARLRYVALPADNSPVTPAQAAAVLEPLRTALALAPPLAENYALLATLLGRSPVPPTPVELAWLAEGARFFPGASDYVLRAVYFTGTGGQAAVARELAELGRRHAASPALRQRFERVQAELKAAP